MPGSSPTLRWIALGTLVLAAANTALAAGEPFREFLDGLRRRGWHDTALEYLELAKSDPLIDDQQRLTIAFERGQTRVELARTLHDPQRRLQELDAARADFEEFLRVAPDHTQAAAASTQLGNVLVERGKTLVLRAGRPESADEREVLLDQARQYYADAEAVFSAAQKKFQDRYASFPTVIDSKHPEELEARRQAQVDLIQARLFSAQLRYDWAHSYPAESAEYREQLEKAAEQYAGLYQDYRRLMAGLVARMWQGRCLQELGNPKQALAYYGELLDQPDDLPEFRQLKSQTLRLALACWIDGPEAKLDEAIRQATEWIKVARPEEEQTAEGLAIHHELARAYQLRANQLAPTDPQRANLLDKALEEATFVARSPGEYQAEARSWVARLRGQSEPQSASSFAEARQQAKTTLDQFEGLLRQVKLAGTSGGSDQLAQLEQQMNQMRAQALAQFHFAWSLADDETPIEELNQVRYFTSYLLLRAGRYYDSAVLGEFLARNYPDGVSGRPAAAVAINAYVEAYNQAPPAERQAEIARLVDLARYVAEKWPTEPEGDQAWMLLADMALRSSDWTQAIEYLDQVPADSPRRAEVELKAGQAFWNRYLAELRSGDTAPEGEAQEDVGQAQARLQRGLELLAAGSAGSGSEGDALRAGAELNLAQIYNAESKFAEALALLERPASGPLALVQSQSPLAQRGNFALETFKAALSAYVGSQNLAQAEATMQSLENYAASQGESASQLTRIYVALGRELEDQLTRLRQSGDQETLNKLVQSFEKFLTQIAARDEGNTFQSLSWVAETFSGLGQGLTGTGPAPAEARKYIEKAAQVYQRIRQRAQDEPGFAPSGDFETGLIVRLARCDRALGNYAEAVDLLVEVLKRKPATLDAQIEAAACYQAWGQTEPRYFASAIHGDRRAKKPDGSIVNIVWGWKKLATTLQGNDRFQQQFHECYFRLAESAFEQARASTGADKQRGLTAAVVLLEQLARTEPNLGGDVARARYNKLYRQLQRALGRAEHDLSSPSAPHPTAQAG